MVITRKPQVSCLAKDPEDSAEGDDDLQARRRFAGRFASPLTASLEPSTPQRVYNGVTAASVGPMASTPSRMAAIRPKAAHHLAVAAFSGYTEGLAVSHFSPCLPRAMDPTTPGRGLLGMAKSTARQALNMTPAAAAATASYIANRSPLVSATADAASILPASPTDTAADLLPPLAPGAHQPSAGVVLLSNCVRTVPKLQLSSSTNNAAVASCSRPIHDVPPTPRRPKKGGSVGGGSSGGGGGLLFRAASLQHQQPYISGTVHHPYYPDHPPELAASLSCSGMVKLPRVSAPGSIVPVEVSSAASGAKALHGPCSVTGGAGVELPLLLHLHTLPSFRTSVDGSTMHDARSRAAGDQLFTDATHEVNRPSGGGVGGRRGISDGGNGTSYALGAGARQPWVKRPLSFRDGCHQPPPTPSSRRSGSGASAPSGNTSGGVAFYMAGVEVALPPSPSPPPPLMQKQLQHEQKSLAAAAAMTRLRPGPSARFMDAGGSGLRTLGGGVGSGGGGDMAATLLAGARALRQQSAELSVRVVGSALAAAEVSERRMQLGVTMRGA